MLASLGTRNGSASAQMLLYSIKIKFLKVIKKKKKILNCSTFNTFCGIVVSPLPKSLLEMQALGPIPKLLNPNL